MILMLLCTDSCSEKVCSIVTNVLLIEVESLNDYTLLPLGTSIIQILESGSFQNLKPLELIPKIASHLSCAVIKEGSKPVGDSPRATLVKQLLEACQKPTCPCRIISILKDLNLDDSQLKSFIIVMAKGMKEVDLAELPSFLYQLIVIAPKGMSSTVMLGIGDLFVSLNNPDILNLRPQATSHFIREIQATIVLHLHLAMKQSFEFSKELLKHIKDSLQFMPMSPHLSTMLVVMFLLSRAYMFHDKVFEFLKAIILKQLKDFNYSEIQWLSVFQKDTINWADILSDLAQKSSSHGWEHVSEALLDFGFCIIEAAISMKAGFCDTNLSRRQNLLHHVSTGIITKIFKNQEQLRKGIISTLIDKITCFATTNTSGAIALLSALSALCPTVIMDSMNKIRESFDYLLYLCPETARLFLSSVLPMIKISPSVRDSLILILRKAMFSKSLAGRKIASSGFLLILKHFKIMRGDVNLSQGSQFVMTQMYSAPQHPRSDSSRGMLLNEQICLDILSSLKKCLSLQAEVRLNVYDNVYEVVCKNPELEVPLLELLLSQASKYVQPGNSTPPVDLQPCVSIAGGDAILIEPIGRLLSALQLCTAKCSRRRSKQGPSDDESEVWEQCRTVLSTLATRTASSELLDWGLDKTTDFSDSPAGRANMLLAGCFSGITWVLMEYAYMGADFSCLEACDYVKKLYAKIQSLQLIIKEKQSSGPGVRTPRANAIKVLQPLGVVSLDFLSQLVGHLLCDISVVKQSGLQLLREIPSLLQDLLVECCSILNQALEHNTVNGPGAKGPEHVFKRLCLLLRSMMLHLTGESCMSDLRFRKDKNIRIPSLVMDLIQSLIGAVCKNYPHRTHELLMSIDEHPTVALDTHKSTEIVHHYVQRFQRLVATILSSPSDDLDLRQAVSLLNVISTLSDQFSPDSPEYMSVHDWLYKIAKEQCYEDSGFIKALFTCLLMSYHRSKGATGLIREISPDLHSKLGDVDEDIEVGASSNFSCITELTAAPTVFLLVLDQCGVLLEEADSLLSKIRSGPSASLESSGDDTGQTVAATRYEGAMCHVLTGLVLAYHELIQTAFPARSCTGALVKVLVRTYGVLTMLTKHFVSLNTKKSSGLSLKFQKLVKLTGVYLNQQVYTMINYVETIASSADKGKTGIETAGGKTKSTKKVPLCSKTRVVKEAKSVAGLIFSMEQYERQLIILSKKSKVDLLEGFKSSTSRDFRINSAALDAACQDTNFSCSATSAHDSEATYSTDGIAAEAAPTKLPRTDWRSSGTIT